MEQLCPCGSQNTYCQCCGAIIEGRISAPTAERLMRSRYTAFTKADVDYLMKSWHSSTRPLSDKADIKRWAKSVKWVKLEILQKEKGEETDTTGMVTFRALFMEGGKVDQIKEESIFEKENGEWVYVSGKHF